MKMTFEGEKQGFIISKGWNCFAEENELNIGDVISLKLISRYVFKTKAYFMQHILTKWNPTSYFLNLSGGKQSHK